MAVASPKKKKRRKCSEVKRNILFWHLAQITLKKGQQRIVVILSCKNYEFGSWIDNKFYSWNVSICFGCFARLRIKTFQEISFVHEMTK